MEEFAEVLAQLKRWTGISLDPGKTKLIEQRLRRCVGEPERRAVRDFLELAGRSASARQRFINAMTTNETYFFRTERVWRHFRQVYLPGWRKANPGRRLEVWSAASSTGEEAYSIAISCAEFAREHPGFNFHVTASDIDTNVIEEARRGVYEGRSAESLWRAHPDLAQRYTEVQDHAVQDHARVLLRSALKAKVEFRQHNLMNAWPGGSGWADIVFLRNVLIYFERAEQTLVLENIRPALRPGGTVILGESESLLNLSVRLAYRAPQIYEKELEAHV